MHQKTQDPKHQLADGSVLTLRIECPADSNHRIYSVPIKKLLVTTSFFAIKCKPIQSMLVEYNRQNT